MTGINKIQTLTVIQMYAEESNVRVIFNINDAVNGNIYQQSVSTTFPIGEVSKKVVLSYIDETNYRFMIEFDGVGYSDSERINLSREGSHRIYVDIAEIFIPVRKSFLTSEEMNANPSIVSNADMVFYAELGGVNYKRRPSNLKKWDIEDNYSVLR